MKIVDGLPPVLGDMDDVALDIEIYQMDESKMHRPTGIFACLSIALLTGDVYQVTDTADIQRALDRIAKGKWIFHNAQFDITHLRRWAHIKPRMVWDTMLVELAMFGGYYDRFGLDHLSRRWLLKKMDKSIVTEFTKRQSMTQKMKKYAALDAWYTLLIKGEQERYLQADEEDLYCCWSIDVPAMWAVMDMEPVKVNVDRWLELAEVHEARAEAIRSTLDFNPGSPKQVVEKLPFLKNSTQRVMEMNRNKAPKLIDTIMEYRFYKKAASTYGRSWIEQNVEEGDLVYPEWRVVGAETGRMSCRSPNLMQIPSRRMPEFRDLFVSKYKGGRLLVADVSQQEPRITAWYSQDEELFRAIRQDDVHLYVARIIFNEPNMKKSDDRRAIGKAINLGMVYGLSEYGLAERLKISKTEAKSLLTLYFQRFRGVMGWMNKSRSTARSLGFIRTASHRRVWINPYNFQWERNAVNAPIQGSAADHTKLALAHLHRNKPFHCTMVIHDELVVDVPPGEMPEQRRLVNKSWRWGWKRLFGDTPIRVDIKSGHSWVK